MRACKGYQSLCVYVSVLAYAEQKGAMQHTNLNSDVIWQGEWRDAAYQTEKRGTQKGAMQHTNLKN